MVKNKKKIRQKKKAKYTKVLADKICDLIAKGFSVRKIIKQKIKGMPNRNTINEWILRHKYFGDQYARSKVIGMEARFDRMMDIAKNEEDVQRARLMVDVIKWQLSKELPKKYGDKLDMTSDGERLVINFGMNKSQFSRTKNKK